MRQTRRDFFGIAVAGALAGSAVTTATGAAVLRATDTKVTTAPCEAPPPTDPSHVLAVGQEIKVEYMGHAYFGFVSSVVYGSVDGALTASITVQLNDKEGTIDFKVRHG